MSSATQTDEKSSATDESKHDRQSDSDGSSEDSMTALADEMKNNTEGEQVTVGELLDSIENRGFGPLILAPAFISASPLGTIPGISLVTGSLIIIIAIQMLFISGHPWVPKRLEEFSISKKRLDKGLDRARPWIKWFDKFIKQRWSFLFIGPMHYVVAVMLIGLSVTYYPLALIPAGVLLPSIANTLFAIAITARDGALLVVGFAASIIAGILTYSYWPF